jgi:hypothetical protein
MSDSLSITGRVHRILPVVTKGNYTTYAFILETGDDPKYYQYPKFETDKAEKLAELKLGSTVEVLFNVCGRVWINPEKQEVWFNSLRVWRIVPQNVADDLPEPVTGEDFADADDLPF